MTTVTIAPDKKTALGSLSKNFPLARYTTWRVGGPAKQVYLPHSLADLQQFIIANPDEQLHWIGLGSNSLIRDAGLDKTVILTLRGLMEMEQCNTTRIWMEAGVPCAKVARYAARIGLAGAEFLAGIPGTMGGALTMNAGCHGHETWDHVIAVKTIDQYGHIHQRYPHEFKIGYRSVHMVQESPSTTEWFIGAELEFDIDTEKKALQNINQLLKHRAATQPTGEYNAGSVFRNPPGDFAGRLIEAAGLKGFRINDAGVSEKHANFIINRGQSSAADIEAVMEHVVACVFEKFGIELIREVRIFGKKP